MKRRPAHGVLVISIDVDGDSGGSGAAATKWLLQLFDQYRLPATWFFNGPGTSVLRSHVIAANAPHEVGLMVTNSGSDSAGRFQFGQNLLRRLLASRAAGVEISSLAAGTSLPIQHLDLLVKHGIRAVRPVGSGCDGAQRSGWAAVSTLRFGISSLPATLRIAHAPAWQRWIKVWDVRRHMTAAARRSHYCHLALDVHTLANAGAREILRQTLRDAANLLDASEMQMVTMASLAATLMAQPSAPRAQSILRAA